MFSLNRYNDDEDDDDEYHYRGRGGRGGSHRRGRQYEPVISSFKLRGLTLIVGKLF